VRLIFLNIRLNSAIYL